MIKTAKLLAVLLLLTFLLVQCNVIWIPPKSYKPAQMTPLEPPVMSLDKYSDQLINTHPRPYIFTLENTSGKGALLVFGAEHTFDPAHPQFSVMKEKWDQFNPSVAIVEGHLDLILRWFFDPVKASGEGGFVQKLAIQKNIKLYSWEPGLQAEIEYALTKVDAMHVASFYCLRPYNNQWGQFSKSEQDKKMNALIRKRAGVDGLKGYLHSVEQVDSLWKADHPGLPSWRFYKHPQNGWPKGKLEQISHLTNEARDDYMCNIILELLNKGERIYISMGSSHAVRIEKTLREMIR